MIDQRHERVYLETDRHRIVGTLTLAKDGYRSRITDHLNAVERDFIALTDVTVELVGQDGPGTLHPYMAVSRRHVVLAMPHADVESQRAT